MKAHHPIQRYACVIAFVAAWAAWPADRADSDAPAGGGPLARPVRVGRLAHPGIRESSGIVASRKHPGVYWTMNDSGNPPRLYAVNATGQSLAVATLRGAQNVDWEDIAADADGNLYVGDFGDNARQRRTLTIYVLPEPDPRKSGAAKVGRAVRFRYPAGQGPFDCEAMFVRGRWAYLITKEPLTARVYRVRLDGPGGQTVDAEYMGPLAGARFITGADISPDGRHIAAVSYLEVCVYDLPEALDKPPATKPAVPARLVAVRPRSRRAVLGQAEAICWVVKPGVSDLLITNERREVFRVRAAAPATAPSAPQR